MSIPVYRNKYDEQAYMSPVDRLDQRFGDEPWPDVPDAVILTLQTYLFDQVTDRDVVTDIDVSTSMYSLYAFESREANVGVAGKFGIGAPALALVVEELIALGVTRFLTVGGCGTLQPTVNPGDAVIAERAIRDEGTSYHYLEPANIVDATDEIVTKLAERATAAGLESHVGTTWTTDGFYRETTAELDHYQSEGVLTVEMEVATLFAIAQFRAVAAGAILTPFDRLTDDEWTWSVADVTPEERLEEVFAIGLEALDRSSNTPSTS